MVMGHSSNEQIVNTRNSLNLVGTYNLMTITKTMAEQINNDFVSLYSTLIRYYNITLQSQKQVLYITSLRNKYYQETVFMLHEDIAPYGSLSIYGFYCKLKSLQQLQGIADTLIVTDYQYLLFLHVQFLLSFSISQSNADLI